MTAYKLIVTTYVNGLETVTPIRMDANQSAAYEAAIQAADADPAPEISMAPA
jgi:hypothetical protein